MAIHQGKVFLNTGACSKCKAWNGEVDYLPINKIPKPLLKGYIDGIYNGDDLHRHRLDKEVVTEVICKCSDPWP